MTTDLEQNKTLSQTIADSTWYTENISFSSNTWNTFQNRSKEKQLEVNAVIAQSVLLTLKTWVDYTDVDTDDTLSIINSNWFFSVPINESNDDLSFEHDFINGCKKVHQNIISNPVKNLEATAKFLLIHTSGTEEVKLPSGLPDILITISEGTEVEITWHINPKFMSEERGQELFKTQEQILFWFIANESTQVLPDLLSKAQREVRDNTNSTKEEIAPRPIHQAFFQYANENPAEVALHFGEKQTKNYGELANEALKLSKVLVDKGVQSTSPTAIILPKGASQIVAVMGILGSGSFYVPIGVEQPIGRQEKIINKAGIKYIVTNTDTLEKYPKIKALEAQGISIVNIDTLDEVKPLEKPIYTNLDALAYIIFTSGSTGEPKGVEIAHQAAWNTIQDINTKFEVTNTDCALAVSALDFDLSVYDIFGLLAVGGKLVLIEEEERKEASRWIQLVEAHKVTVWNSVPALFDMLLISASEDNDLSSLRLVLVSGDWVGLDLKDRLIEKSESCKLVALGGATEASIWSNYFIVNEVDKSWRSIPYGKPLANQKYRVVNTLGNDCPNGVIGELWIGGTGVASGYTNNPELTASRFVTYQNEKWYRTGDLGRYWFNGNLEFLGRMDHQVKVNGFRIELGEIEAALKTYDGVNQATAIVYIANQSLQLVAGVVGDNGEGTTFKTNVFDNQNQSDVVKAEYNIQKQIVAKFLYGLLDLSSYDIPYKNETAIAPENTTEHIDSLRAKLVANMNIANEQLPVLDMWLNWLTEAHILISKNNELVFNVVAHTESELPKNLEEFKTKLEDRKPLLQQILSNDIPSLYLLDDDLLSPEVLSTQDTGVLAGIKQVAQKINEKAAASNTTLKVAILGGRTGLLTEKLLSNIEDNNNIEFSVIDEGKTMLRNFTERLTEAGYTIDSIEQKQNQVPEENWYNFDFVVSIFTLHRFTNPSDGVFISHQLLNNGGRLLSLESELLMPIGLISSGVIDKGFQNFDKARRAKFNPMLDKEAWAKYFQKIGYDSLETIVVENSSSLLYDASSAQNRIQLKSSGILDHIQEALPPHMIPEKIAILPYIPLSANGKVDRKLFSEQITSMIDADVRKNQGNYEEPVGEMEEKVAEIWKDLLELEIVSRKDVFFEIGGDSLSATRFLTEVKKEFEVSLSLRELFGANLQDIAAKIEVEYQSLQEELETMEIGEI
ncbi:MAG: amino acid adenylation domain-containing protein [Flavobacteriaceae bacterium]|nr:amino acid adenylation domain-containing protein [Flavobacteriaceae bacterium]